ncbi:MAG: translation initiation factor IF-2 [Sumerlaeia bacterium]
MQIKQVAELLGVEPKQIATEVDNMREDLTAKGFKVPKRVTVASKLEDAAVNFVLAAMDQRKKEKAPEKAPAATDAKREQEEKTRREAAERKKSEEEEAKKRREEMERQRRAEMERRRQEMARMQAMQTSPTSGAPRVGPPSGPRRPGPDAPAGPPTGRAVVVPPMPQAPQAPEAPQGPPPAAGPAPMAQQSPQGPPSAAAPQQQHANAPAAQQPPQPAPPQGRAPHPGQQQGQPGQAPPPQQPRPGYQGQNPRPYTPGPRPQQGFRPQQSTAPPRQGGAPMQPGMPRQQGPGAPRGPYQGGGPGGAQQRPGQPFNRGPRPGGGPGGPGGPHQGGPRPPRRDDQQGRPGAPGGPQQRRPRTPLPTGSPSMEDLQSFADQGFMTSIDETTQRARRQGPSGGKDRRPAKKDTPEERPRKRPAAAPTDRKSGRGDGKRFRPTQIFNGEVISRRPTAGRPGRKGGGGKGRRGHDLPQQPKRVKFTGDFTVGQFAEKAGVASSDVIRQLMLMGEMLTMNEILEADLAELVAEELGFEVVIQRESDELDVEEYVDLDDSDEDLLPRAPIVTVMGHVDHGKTTLLDAIRDADVVSGEHGGITQHIGAYHVVHAKGPITFLDTPGHAAFTAMRARGANVTDLVVLVVAANDGVMPQTREAISHARAAEVPIIVAINKMDAPGANPMRVKQELMQYEMVSEDLGGETIMVEVSALKKTGVDELLDMILLQSEVLELKANPNRNAVGTIVEARMDALRGATATVLVENGTLEVGDHFVCGTEYGRIRAMRNDRGETIKEAGPAIPVEILGVSGSPEAGEQFIVLPTEQEAREIAERRADRRRMRSAATKTTHVTLENLSEHLSEGEVKELNLIVKADVQGSVEAIAASLMKIESNKVTLRILHSGVGAVGEGDVQLADASDAIILGFNVRPEPAARRLAEQEGVEIRTYNVIYELLEEIEKAMLGLVDPEFSEQDMARITVQEIYKVSKIGTIAGCFVEEGTVARDHKARLVRNGSVIWTGDIASLRRFKDDAKEVNAGLECGIGLKNFNDVKVGDVIETFVMKELAVTLVSTT